MILTRDAIHAGKSDAGGWTRRQVRLLGIDAWPLQKGWLSGLIGKWIPDESYRAFLDLKNVKNLNMLKRKPPKEHPELFRGGKTPEQEINDIYLANRAEFD